MKLFLYKGRWAGDSPNGFDVCEKHNITVIVERHQGKYDKQPKECPVVELNEDQLMALCLDVDIDVLVCGGEDKRFIAFDKAGRHFGQR